MFWIKKMLIFVFCVFKVLQCIRRELGGTGTGCLYQFTYCVTGRQTMVYIFYTTYTSVDLAHNEIVRAKLVMVE